MAKQLVSSLAKSPRGLSWVLQRSSSGLVLYFSVFPYAIQRIWRMTSPTRLSSLDCTLYWINPCVCRRRARAWLGLLAFNFIRSCGCMNSFWAPRCDWPQAPEVSILNLITHPLLVWAVEVWKELRIEQLLTCQPLLMSSGGRLSGQICSSTVMILHHVSESDVRMTYGKMSGFWKKETLW